MKPIVIIFLSLLAICGMSQSPQESFSESNRTYEAGNFDQAFQGYQKLIKEGNVSKELFYNYANTAFQLDKKAIAILYFEKAIRLAPGDKNIKNNLSIARESIDTEIIDIPDFLPVRMWKGFSSFLSPLIWFVLQLLLGIAIVFSIYKWRISPNPSQKLKGFYSLIVSSLMFVLCFFAHQTSYKLLHQDDIGIVMQKTQLKSAPDTRSDDLKSLSEGVKIHIQDQIDNWVKVVLTNQEKGWIEKSVIEEI